MGDTDLDLTASSSAAVKLLSLLAGDMNGDGSIDVSDLNIVWNSANFNKSVEAAAAALADVDGNGSIDVSDLNIVWNATNFNKGVGDCSPNWP